MIKSVIFDLDDTLFPEMDYVRSGFRAVAKQIKSDFGYECYQEMLTLFYEKKENVYDRVLKLFDVSYKVGYIDRLIELYRNHIPENLSFYSDVQPLLDKLKASHIKTGIITDGRVGGQTNKLTALKCYNIFDEVIITDALGGVEYRKPHPKPFDLMKEKLCVEYWEMAYIGDNPQKDFAIGGIYPIITIEIERRGKINDGKVYRDNIFPSYKITSLESFMNIIEDQ